MTTEAKPPMTRKTASLHESRAAIDARKKAQAKGADQSAIDAMMIVGDHLEVAGLKLKPYSLATLWALQAVSSKYLENEQRPADSFAKIDRDGDGMICLNDVFGAAPNLPADVIQEWFAKVLGNGSAQITLEQFVAARGLPREVKPQDIIIAAICFAEPRETYFAAERGGLDEIMNRAFDVASQIQPPQMAQINLFISRQFSILEGGKDPAQALGKSQAAPAPASP